MSFLANNFDSRNRSYDLAERTARFGEDVIRFAKSINRNVVTEPLIKQLVRSSTSIGANFTEADNASSQKEFKHKIGICRKEADETKYWLRMIAVAAPEVIVPARVLWSEARQLHLILAKIFQNQTRIGKTNTDQSLDEK